MGKEKDGKVYLVGAGPGDPGLLTLKAKECLSQADVVVYDSLANEVFLKYAHSKAELIYVGKKGGCHTMKQDEINNLLVKKAKEGRKVVRLKGGDPFIFGRGGEEARDLATAGISFEVVPGVSSAIAVPAYAGIPLTHRDYNSTVTFVTGHEDPTKKESDIAWEALAKGKGTLVFLMGVGNLPRIAENLMEHGRSPDTPVAIIENGTVPEQKTITGRLQDISEKARKEGLKPPAIIVVGDIVNLRGELEWFEKRPLFGKRIVVTRAREQASDFLIRLNALGAACIEFPTIEVVPPPNWDALDRAIMRLGRYQWVLFTSVNGVKFFFERLNALKMDVREMTDLKVGGIGPKTAQAIEEKGIKPDLVPDEYRAEAIVAGMKKEELEGARILLPRATKARDVLPVELVNRGAIVDEVPAYQTINPGQDTARVRKMLEQGAVHMVTFTSSSTVNNFMEMFQAERDQIHKWMENVAVACIGPVTAQTAEKKGLSVSVTPPEYTIESLTRAIVQFFKSRRDLKR
jgi:uroporphyrinogen III methyltransferase/synthase